MNQINQLTTEQKSLIPAFREKWQKIAFSTEPTNHQEITRAIEEIYCLISTQKPAIYFCDRPISTQEVLLDIDLNAFGSSRRSAVYNILLDEIKEYIKSQITENLWNSLNNKLRVRNFDWKPFWSWNYLEESFAGFYSDDISFYEGKVFYQLIHNGIIFDYCRTVIGFFSDSIENKWRIFKILVNNCSQIFFYENICIIYEKLSVLSVDDDGWLHNDGKPAIQFSNGTSIYACHGNTIPEQYGIIPVSQWQTQWLMEVEKKLRDILILGIGEGKIYRELQTKEKINQVGLLTPEQKILINLYRNKWQKIVFSTERCNRKLATKYINYAYEYLRRETPEVVFFDSPLLAQEYAVAYEMKADLRKHFVDNICKSADVLDSYIDRKIIDEVENEMNYADDSYTYYRNNYRHLTNPVGDRIRQKFGQVIKCIKPESMVIDAAIQDYLLFNFDCEQDTTRIEIFVGIIENCGWIYPYQEVCLVGDRPINLHLDEDYLLHAEGKPAIEYADGLSIYANHGGILLRK